MVRKVLTCSCGRRICAINCDIVNFTASKLAAETEKNEDEGLNMHRVLFSMMLYN